MRFALGLIAALAPSAAAGWTVAGLSLASERSLPGRVLRLGLAILVGLGLSSLTLFAWQLCGGTSLGSGYLAFDCLALLSIAAAAVIWRRRHRPPELPAPAPGRVAPAEWALLAALVLAWSLCAALFVLVSHANPHGSWDAWAIWNLRARFLVRAGAEWRSAFASDLGGHPEYPALLPDSVARLFAFTGAETTAAPAVVAGLFTLGGSLVLVGALGLVHRPAALLAGLLLATPSWIALGSRQYADVPVAGYLAAALALLALARRREAWAPQPLALAGLCLGLAAWTKNEGVLACAVIASLFALAWWRQSGLRAAASSLGWLALGAVAPALARGLFQILLAPGLAPEIFAAQQTTALIARILDPSRYWLIGRFLLMDTPGARYGVPLLAIAGAFALGARPRAMLASPGLQSVMVMLLAFVTIYVVTPLPLEIYLQDTCDRLLIQLWPAFLFAVLTAVPVAPAAAKKPAEGAT